MEERFPPGAWELPRRNILSWTDDLTRAPQTDGLQAASDRLFELGRRITKTQMAPAFDAGAYDELDDIEGGGEVAELPSSVYPRAFPPPSLSQRPSSSSLMPPPPLPPIKSQKSKAKEPTTPSNAIENDPPVSSFFLVVSL